MNDKKKALTSAVLYSICSLIWIIVSIINLGKLAGTTMLILLICAAIAFVVGAIIWFIRYVKLGKSKE